MASLGAQARGAMAKASATNTDTDIAAALGLIATFRSEAASVIALAPDGWNEQHSGLLSKLQVAADANTDEIFDALDPFLDAIIDDEDIELPDDDEECP